MISLTNPARHYAWGSLTAIPEFLGVPSTAEPVAEWWMGAHSSAPSRSAAELGGVGLDSLIAADVVTTLGADVVARFGPALPYLLKLIAAETPLSLQVHPHLEQARAGHAAEDAAGIPIDAPHRNYRDTNHKPELVYALTSFEAVCGFRAPRRAAELLAGLDAPLAQQLHQVLIDDPSPQGIRSVFTRLLEPLTRPTRAEVLEVAHACAARLAASSTSPRADRIVVALAGAFPGDPGVVTSLLLNPVTLHPGEAMFIPAGGVHAYLHGFAVEVMASSDNVLRAGLTSKHIDVAELLRSVDYVAAPPTRIAPEILNAASKIFYAPVDDFQLSVTEVADGDLHLVPGRGPRILLCLEGELTFTWGSDTRAGGQSLTLGRGQTAFAPASDGPLTVQGAGTVVQADVP
ncbi:mannose-6-phosphate isomerase, class I [Pengzhenrongella phosphoraccumulans]|uniref:mannose-6-phosphate isomerase, class I n=1 Tax=Pengzhenrongella phosphoraccumulans TaxID=3114394 RepID=UPI00388D26AC